MARRTTIFFLFIFLLILGGCGKEQERARMRSIGMAGVADTLVVPDLVVWTVKMNDLDPLLVEAKRANDEKLAAVLDALAKIDIVEGSVRAGPARIERQFRRCDDGVNRFSHFSVRRTVTFQQNDPEAVEKALDALVSAADIESSCYFDLSDTESIMKMLRTRAIDQAREKAESLATHVGLDLGVITGVSVQENLDPYRRQRQLNDMNGNVSGPQAQLLSSQVRVNFATLYR